MTLFEAVLGICVQLSFQTFKLRESSRVLALLLPSRSSSLASSSTMSLEALVSFYFCQNTSTIFLKKLSEFVSFYDKQNSHHFLLFFRGQRNSHGKVSFEGNSLRQDFFQKGQGTATIFSVSFSIVLIHLRRQKPEVVSEAARRFAR